MSNPDKSQVVPPKGDCFFTRLRTLFLVLFVIVTATVAVRWPLLQEGNIPGRGDTLLNFLPFKIFAAQSILDGELPLWVPNMFCGQPFLADPQSAVLSPFTVPFFFFSPRVAFTVYILLKHILAGAFLYGFLRSCSVSKPGALFAGMVFTLSSTIYRQIAWQEAATPVIWLPLLLWLCERVIREPRRFWSFFGITSVAACMNLSGHPQNTYYAYMVAGIYLLLRIPFHLGGGASVKNTLRSSGLILAGLGLAGGIAVVQVLPLFEFTAATRYADGFDINYAATPALDPELIPRVFLGGIFPDIEAHDRTCYLGILSLFLVPVGLFSRRKIGLIFGILSAFLLVVSVGLKTPVFEFMFDHLPGFHSLHEPTRLLVVLPMLMAALTGLGLDTVIRRFGQKRQEVHGNRVAGRTLLIFAILLTTGSVLFLLLPDAPDLPFPVRNLLLLGPPALLLLVLVCQRRLSCHLFTVLAFLMVLFDLLHFDITRYPVTFPLTEKFLSTPEAVKVTMKDPEIHRSGVYNNGFRIPKRSALPRAVAEEKIACVYPNMSMMTGIHDPQGLYSLKVERYAELARAMIRDKKGGRWVQDRMIFLGAPFSPLFDMVNMKYMYTTELGSSPITDPLVFKDGRAIFKDLPRPASSLMLEIIARREVGSKEEYTIEVEDESGTVTTRQVFPGHQEVPAFSCYRQFDGEKLKVDWEPSSVHATRLPPRNWTLQGDPSTRSWEGNFLLIDSKGDTPYVSPEIPFRAGVSVSVQSTPLDTDDTAVCIKILTGPLSHPQELYRLVFNDEGLTLIHRKGRGRIGTRSLSSSKGETANLRFVWLGDEIRLVHNENPSIRFRDLESFSPATVRIALGSKGGRVSFSQVGVDVPTRESDFDLDRLFVPLESGTPKSVTTTNGSGETVRPRSIKLLDTEKFVEIHREGAIGIFENKEVLPRAFLVGGYQVTESKERLSALGELTFNPREQVYLEEDPEVKWGPGPRNVEGTVEIQEYRRNRIKFDITAEEDAFLFQSDTFFPGWMAELDGNPVPILRANHAFRCVVIPEGQHTLVMTYRPGPLVKGAWISAGTAVIWLLLPVVRFSMGRRRRRTMAS